MKARFAGRRRGRGVFAALLVLLLAPSLALAHAVVYPSRSAPGAYERYVIRVPNEKATATTRVEIVFPAGARVVSFADVPGWTLEVLTDSTGRISGAVWTGTLEPERFVELPFIAVNPRQPAQLVWPVYQTYADGERVAWAGPEGSDQPASVTAVGASDAAVAGGAATVPGWVKWVAIAALALAFIALGVGIRPGQAG
jgi:uncharacterized protein YcnI